jgi:hypothetical protein
MPKPFMQTIGRASSAGLAIALAACTITPRTGKPAELAKTHKGLDAAVDCVLARLNASMSQGKPPNFTHTVSVVTPGQVVEIIPHEIPSGGGELYVVRFMAAADGTTNVTLFSTLEGVDRRVENAMAPCIDKPPKPPKPPSPQGAPSQPGTKGQSGDAGGLDNAQLPWLSQSKPNSQ